MQIGVPTEVKNHEYRVAITPAGVNEFVRNGHSVVVEAGAGIGSSITDAEFEAAGATIAAGYDQVWSEADMILKVKEPIADRVRPDAARVRCCSPTSIWRPAGTAPMRCSTRRSSGSRTRPCSCRTAALPLLAPMSEVAGRLAPQVGAYHLMRQGGGRGTLMGGVSGVYAAKVVVIGAGVSGMNAAAIALGMQAEVLLLDKNIDKLREVDRIYQGHLQTVASNAFEVERAVLDADLVIGAVLVPGAKAPMLISNELVSRMRPGSVLVDIAIDQGGCFEDSRPTTHDRPTYPVHNSVFYCVANMPGAVPHTSTYALTNVTLPYAVSLANKGWQDALRADPALALGLNTYEGELVSAPVAQAHGMPHRELTEVLA